MLSSSKTEAQLWLQPRRAVSPGRQGLPEELAREREGNVSPLFSTLFAIFLDNVVLTLRKQNTEHRADAWLSLQSRASEAEQQGDEGRGPVGRGPRRGQWKPPVQPDLLQGGQPQGPAPLLGQGYGSHPCNPRAYFSGLRQGSKNSGHTWAGQVREQFLTLFFSNFQFSSWARIWSTTAVASFPWRMYSRSWQGWGRG